MQPDERDAARLWDMLTYAREIRQTVSGATFEHYMADDNLRPATERRLEIIGEAARNVSRTLQDAHPQIPWRQIIGLRHVMAHEYGDIGHERVFRVAADSIPALIAALETLVPQPPS
jgi:uncharacterized protein with HEPN domain